MHLTRSMGRRCLLVVAIVLSACRGMGAPAEVSQSGDSAGLPSGAGATLDRARSVLDAAQSDEERAFWRVEFVPESAGASGAPARVLWGRLLGLRRQEPVPYYELCRVELRDGRVSASELRFRHGVTLRQTFPMATSFDVSPSDFERAWTAMRAIVDANAIESIPYELRPPGGGGSSAHTSGDNICAYLADDPVPIYADGFERGYVFRGEIRTWDQIRADSIIKLWRDLLDRAPSRSVPAETWGEIASAEIRGSAGTALQEVPLGQHAILGALLHVAGLYAPEECAPTIARFATEESGLNWEASVATSMLELRHHWDVSAAIGILRRGESRPRPDLHFRWFIPVSLVRWTTWRFHEIDREGFMSYVTSEFRNRSPGRGGDCKDDLRTYAGRDWLYHLESLLDEPDPEVRVEAALLCVAIDARHTVALRALDAVARDVTLEANDPWRQDPRSKALDFVIGDAQPGQGLWEDSDLERQACAAGERAEVIAELVKALDARGRPLASESVRAAWRGALETNSRSGLVMAARSLIQLDDRESASRVRQAIECLERDRVDGATDLREAYDVWTGR